MQVAFKNCLFKGRLLCTFLLLLYIFLLGLHWNTFALVTVLAPASLRPPLP